MGQSAKRHTVIVTGGARRLGAIIVRELALRGHRVVVHHHHSDLDARALVADLSSDGRIAIALEQDLAAADAAARLLAATRQAFGGPVTAIVNSASLFVHDQPPIADGGAIERHMAVNLSAPVLLASAMAGQSDLVRGAIVNILDQKLANLNPDFFSYTCSKLALAGATTMLAQAFGPRISVNAVSPGLTLPSSDQSAAEFAAVASINLLQRPVDARKIAEAIAYLLEADGVTGQNIYVDNGQRFVPMARDVMFSTRDAVAHG